MTDKISIVMPCYKGERYVADIVGDVVRQTYSNWELICVSNGAGQEPQLEILRRLAAADTLGRIKVLSEEIGNVSRARNIGIDVATGKWITFADQDDRITTDHLQRYAEAVSGCADGEPDMVCGGITHRWQREKMEKAVPMSATACGSDGKRMIAEAVTPLLDVVWNKLFLASFLRQTGVRFETDILEDSVFVHEFLLRTDKVCAIPMTGYTWIHRGTTSNGGSRYHALFEKRFMKVARLHCELLCQVGYTDEEIEGYKRGKSYLGGFFGVLNLFRVGCGLSFGEKKAEVRRLVFADDERWRFLKQCDRAGHNRAQRVFDRLVDSRSPWLMTATFTLLFAARYRFAGIYHRIFRGGVHDSI